MSQIDLRINSNGSQYIKDWEFFLGDMDIGKYMRNIKLELGIDKLPAIATIEFIVKPDIPENLLALLEIELNDPLELVKDV